MAFFSLLSKSVVIQHSYQCISLSIFSASAFNFHHIFNKCRKIYFNYECRICVSAHPTPPEQFVSVPSVTDVCYVSFRRALSIMLLFIQLVSVLCAFLLPEGWGERKKNDKTKHFADGIRRQTHKWKIPSEPSGPCVKEAREGWKRKKVKINWNFITSFWVFQMKFKQKSFYTLNDTLTNSALASEPSLRRIVSLRAIRYEICSENKCVNRWVRFKAGETRLAELHLNSGSSDSLFHFRVEKDEVFIKHLTIVWSTMPVSW